jgi:glycosyltransferase involved in cell wall biosynthesis
MTTRPEILVLCDYYLPGFKAGGPIRSIFALVNALKDEFAFHIVTRDRDYNDGTPYKGVPVGRWIDDNGVQVMYLEEAKFSFWGLLKLVKSKRWKGIYVNSFFSPRTSLTILLLRYLSFIRTTPILIAPRGELGRGALKIKSYKKMPFRIISKVGRFHRGVSWHASTDHEASDIRAEFGETNHTVASNIFVASDIATTTNPVAEAARFRKRAGEVNLVFLSRICEMKNLEGALSILSDCRSQVHLHVYGPIEDQGYWMRCVGRIEAMPKNVSVAYQGIVPPDQVVQILSKYHALFLPSLGENFGHVILEAFSAGLPVILSDRTPWRELAEKGVGWDLSLADNDAFVAAIEFLASMSAREHQEMKEKVAQYFESVLTGNALAREQNRHMFRKLVQAVAS